MDQDDRHPAVVGKLFILPAQWFKVKSASDPDNSMGFIEMDFVFRANSGAARVIF
jgi:hypothetical protein